MCFLVFFFQIWAVCHGLVFCSSVYFLGCVKLLRTKVRFSYLLQQNVPKTTDLHILC